jgi:hypothetical protein
MLAKFVLVLPGMPMVEYLLQLGACFGDTPSPACTHHMMKNGMRCLQTGTTVSPDDPQPSLAEAIAKRGTSTRAILSTYLAECANGPVLASMVDAALPPPRM